MEIVGNKDNSPVPPTSSESTGKKNKKMGRALNIDIPGNLPAREESINIDDVKVEELPPSKYSSVINRVCKAFRSTFPSITNSKSSDNMKNTSTSLLTTNDLRYINRNELTEERENSLIKTIPELKSLRYLRLKEGVGKSAVKLLSERKKINTS